jgi:hypothetical protein
VGRVGNSIQSLCLVVCSLQAFSRPLIFAEPNVFLATKEVCIFLVKPKLVAKVVSSHIFFSRNGQL